MCQVSDKIKLCSCKTKNVEQLKNYWTLNRTGQIIEFVVGEIFLPADIDKEINKLNKKTILSLLNKGEIFDIEMQHQENDILELHFSLPEYFGDFSLMERNYLCYCFKFKDSKWRVAAYDPNIRLDIIQQGKIKNAFRKSKY